jgi:hypothetical protein
MSMSQHSTGLSKHEKKRPRLRGRPTGPAPKKEPVDVAPLLLDRKTTARLLSVSESTLIAMEQAGTLDPIKLSRSENGKTYYRRAQVMRIAEGGVTPTEEKDLAEDDES